MFLTPCFKTDEQETETKVNWTPDGGIQVTEVSEMSLGLNTTWIPTQPTNQI